MRKINVAVIGAGYWGKKVISEYAQLCRKNDGAHLVAVCDMSNENLRYCKENIDVPYLTKNYEEVISTPGIQAVNICTPNETHYQICKGALENGKHVLIEKPMTLNSADALELVELAHERNLVLSVGHIFRFNNAIRKARSLIREGFFGDIFYLKLQWTTTMPLVENRDIITDLAPHPFDILNYLLDAWPQKITCKAEAYRRERLEEMAYILSEFNDNVIAHIELSWLLPGKIREVTIVASERSAKISCLTQKITIFEKEHSYEIGVRGNNTIETELKHFLACINNNGAKDLPYKNENNGEIGAGIVKLLETTRKSLEEERTMYYMKPSHKLSLYLDDLEQVGLIKNKRSVLESTDSRLEKPLYSVIKNIQIGEGTKIYDQVNLYKCKIGKNCKIDAYAYIEADVEIGNNCKIRPFNFIPTGVTIEDNVYIGPNVIFTNDKYPKASGSWQLIPTKIKKGASIGANSVILPGVCIGENALVGAGSVITKNVPDNAVVAGNPARIIYYQPRKMRLA